MGASRARWRSVMYPCRVWRQGRYSGWEEISRRYASRDDSVAARLKALGQRARARWQGPWRGDGRKARYGAGPLASYVEDAAQGAMPGRNTLTSTCSISWPLGPSVSLEDAGQIGSLALLTVVLVDDVKGNVAEISKAIALRMDDGLNLPTRGETGL